MGDKKTIWVVEDEPLTMMLIAKKLNETGHNLVKLKTTDEVATKLASEKPDLLITDNLTALDVIDETGRKKMIDSKITGLQLVELAKGKGVEKTILTSASDLTEEAKNAGAVFVQKTDRTWPSTLKDKAEGLIGKVSEQQTSPAR